MTDKELLNEFSALSMELQSEYSKNPQNFDKQYMMELRWKALQHQILQRMSERG